MSSAAAKERRARLRLPIIPQRVDGFTHNKAIALPLPHPLPLPRSQPQNPPKPAGGAPLQMKVAEPEAEMLRPRMHCSVSRNPDPCYMAEAVDISEVVRISLLGHGSGGKVYKVQHRGTGKVYALKIIQEKHEELVRRQILLEMQILRRANSPYVVSCHSISDCGGEISFLLEFMDCGSVADLLLGGAGSLADKKNTVKTMTEPFLADVAKQVLHGLVYLHKNKIVHRDIKPSNLLINSKKQVKIADFGVSTVLTSTLAPCNSFVGTCAYMSPERFDPDSHGGKYDGYAADIWSLGLSLLECYIGHFPFVGPGQKADWPTLMVAICFGDPPVPPSHASPEFRNFIKHCLLKDASKRPTATQLLTHPFITMHESKPAPPFAKPYL